MNTLLIGQSTLPQERDIIRKVLAEHENAHGVIYARSLYLALIELLMKAQARMAAGLRFPDIAEMLEPMEQAIRERLAHARLIAVAPVIGVSDDLEVPAYEQDG